MSLWKQLLVALTIGTAIGVTVPFATNWLTTVDRLRTPVAVTATAEEQVQIYHFTFRDKLLSVVEGNPGESGKVILSGLDVKDWPIDFLNMAPKVVFYSLDEVQSFIDTVCESLWIE